MIRRLAALLAVVAIVASACGSGAKYGGVKELNILTWEGYESAEVVARFEKETGIKINATNVGADDELFAKLNAGGGTQYDIVAINKVYLSDLVAKGTLLPIDESKVPNLANVADVFKDSTKTADGKRGSVPYVFGAFPVTYNPKDIQNPEASYSTILSPDSPYCGKIGWIDSGSDMIQFAAFYLGMPNPYELTDADYQKITDLLIETKKKCVKVITPGYGEAANAFVAGEISIAPSQGPLLNKNALDQGVELADLGPKEGVTYFVDGHAITKGGEKKLDAVYAFLNYTLDKDTQKTVTTQSFWGGVIKGLASEVDPSVAKLLHIDDEAFFKTLINQEAPHGVDSIEKRFAAWDRVKAAN